jgi:UDP-GlcNAc:undecaprenyl-phosphate GlcNAc-1-phosphate transferase
MIVQILIIGFVSLLTSLLLTPFVRRWAVAKGITDDPADPRRMHKTAMPRWGGLAIGAATLVGATVARFGFGFGQGPESTAFEGVLLVGVAVLLMGALDDKLDFSAGTQAIFLLLCGLVVQLFGVQITGVSRPWHGPGESNWFPLGNWAWPVTAIWMFVVSKTMDTIDGLDGLAAGIAAISATTLAILALQYHPPMAAAAALAAAVCGACIGFLRHNYNPAKIIMGTGGAQFLGFTLAGLSVIGASKTAAVVTVGIPVLIFAIPIFDAFFVVFRRILHRQPIYKADKRHIHHHLISKGLSQRQTVLVLYAVAIVLCATALWIFGKSRDDRHSTGQVASFGTNSFRDPAGRHQDGAGYQGAGAISRSSTA